jgi:hypothetical protein
MYFHCIQRSLYIFNAILLAGVLSQLSASRLGILSDLNGLERRQAENCNRPSQFLLRTRVLLSQSCIQLCSYRICVKLQVDLYHNFLFGKPPY